MGSKGWGIFFGAVLLASFLLCVISPFVGWWLPINVASFGGEVDYLYYVILGFTTFFFVLTEAILVYAMCRYAWKPNVKAAYVEGNHRLEMMWTIVPAGILLYIAIVQIGAWERIKYQSHMPVDAAEKAKSKSDLPEVNLVMQVTARQWDWTMRYPFDPKHPSKLKPDNARRWAENPDIDDIYLPDELHCWKGANVRIYLKTQDVLHSLFLPQLRLKQDALPGKTIPVWFNATEANARFNETTGKTELLDPSKLWEIACAELCGGGHYRMRGLLYVHESDKDYQKWLEHAGKAAGSHEPEKRPPTIAAKD